VADHGRGDARHDQSQQLKSIHSAGWIALGHDHSRDADVDRRDCGGCILGTEHSGGAASFTSRRVDRSGVPAPGFCQPFYKIGSRAGSAQMIKLRPDLPGALEMAWVAQQLTHRVRNRGWFWMPGTWRLGRRPRQPGRRRDVRRIATAAIMQLSSPQGIPRRMDRTVQWRAWVGIHRATDRGGDHAGAE
jgi:hypothetical protein